MVQHAGDIEQGVQLMQKAMEEVENHINDSSIMDKKTLIHIKYSQMLTKYGRMLRTKGGSDLQEAQEVLEKALDLQEKCLHENSIMTIRTLYNLGTVYHKLGLYGKAEKCMSTALERIDSIDSSHPYKATIATGLARLMVDKFQPSPNLPTAQLQLQNAIKIRSNTTKCCGETHHKVAYAYETLGDIALSKGEVISAHSFLMIAFSLRDQLIARETSQKAVLQAHLNRIPGDITFIDKWKEHCKKIETKLLDCPRNI